MFTGKRFIRYPFNGTSARDVSKLFYRYGGAYGPLGSLLVTEAKVEVPDSAAVATLPIHTITDIVLGGSAHPAPLPGIAIEPSNCFSFLCKGTGQALHLEGKDAKQAAKWTRAIQALLLAAKLQVNVVQGSAAVAAVPMSPGSGPAPAMSLPPMVIGAMQPLQTLQPMTPMGMALQPIGATPTASATVTSPIQVGYMAAPIGAPLVTSPGATPQSAAPTPMWGATAAASGPVPVPMPASIGPVQPWAPAPPPVS